MKIYGIFGLYYEDSVALPAKAVNSIFLHCLKI